MSATITITKGYTFGATELVTNTKLHTLVDSSTATISGIVGGEIASGASIAYNKLSLSGGILGSDIASGASIVYTQLAQIGAASMVCGSAFYGLATIPSIAGIIPLANRIEGITANTDDTTITFDLSTSSKHSVTLGGNRTLALSNPTTGQVFSLRLLQDGTGSRTVTWFTTIKWAGGSAPTLTTTASKADWFGFICTGTDTYDGFVIGQNL